MVDTLDFSGFAAPMAPGQAGTGGFVAPTVDDPWTATNQIGNAGSNINAIQIAKALNDLSAGLKQSQGSGGSQQQQGTPAGTARSDTGQGSSAGINALIQMLMQRANQYFPGQPNRQPVALGRPSGGGLLGI